MVIKYFAWIRDQIGKGEEIIEFEVSKPATVYDLIHLLKKRGGPYAKVFTDTAGIKVAVNHVYATQKTPLHAGDEVAFFPPVTGG